MSDERHWSAMKNLTIRLAILLLSTLCLLTGAFAQFTPSQDSYTFSSKAGQNYGTAQALQVESALSSHEPQRVEDGGASTAKYLFFQ